VGTFDGEIEGGMLGEPAKRTIGIRGRGEERQDVPGKSSLEESDFEN
jgi:hypothetical protein